MKQNWKDRITRFLSVYRERLEKAEEDKDNVEYIRLEAQISLLETLYIYAVSESNE